MAKLPSIRAREVVRVAESIGFVLDRRRGSHAVYLRASDRRRVVIPMHGTKDLKPGTLRGIITGARSCKFTLNGSVVAGTEAQGQVTLNGVPVKYNDPNGWKLNGNKEIEFVGTTCTTIKTEPNAEVKVRFPCGAVVDIGVQ